ncbi:MAG: CotH kinase family protein [Proteobacteria bacterium]|nr:CotH kinase family protein [Pseudomonadota bacterium]
MALAAYLSTQHYWLIVKAADKLDATFGIYDVKHIGAFVNQRLQGFLVKPEVLQIDIKHINVQNLEYQRDTALNGVTEFTYVPADLIYEGKKFKSKLRLKGDRDIHFDHLDTASYRVKIRGNQSLWGMKFFSLHKPRARNYIHEWIFLEMMNKEGVISPRYKFVKVVVNGKDNGVYAVEEHYTKLLLENRQSREGPILRFDESTGTNYVTSTITPYEQSKWLSKENLPVAQIAIQLLEGYRRGELAFPEVFDVKKWAIFFAVSDMTSSMHAQISKSLRIYYNPITSRLEPIPFDGHYGTCDKRSPFIAAELGITEEKNWTYATDRDWFYGLFNDPKSSNQEFLAAYIAELEKLSNVDYLDKFFATARADLDHNLAIINSETNWHDNIFSFGPIPYVYKESDYYDIAKYVRGLLIPRLDAFVVEHTENEIVVEIINRHKALPVLILGAGCGSSVFRAKDPIKVNARTASNREAEPVKVVLEKMGVGDTANECLQLFVKLPGLDSVQPVPLRPWRPSDSQVRKSDVARKPGNYQNYDFFELRDGKKLVMSQGQHTLDETVVVDGVEELQIHPGTNLTLTNNASLIVRASAQLHGTSEFPIVIHGDNGGGFAVIGAKGESKIENVVFDKLSNPQDGAWALTGAVTFYESPVSIRSTQFLNNSSEDAFNGIRSKIEMVDSTFKNVLRDAVDVDFGNIKIRELVFEDVGNDAIDVSGTTAEVESVSIRRTGDKGISVGERSSLYGKNIDIANVKIGVAGKDGSKAIFDGLRIDRANIGYAVFQKKPEHGPGLIESRGTEHHGVGELAVVEMGSSLMINGMIYEGNLADIRERLYEE